MSKTTAITCIDCNVTKYIGISHAYRLKLGGKEYCCHSCSYLRKKEAIPKKNFAQLASFNHLLWPIITHNNKEKVFKDEDIL